MGCDIHIITEIKKEWKVGVYSRHSRVAKHKKLYNICCFGWCQGFVQLEHISCKRVAV